MEYIKIDQDVRVILHNETHEGWNGEYDDTDPTDQCLLRFDIDHWVDNDWEPVDNGSYCTGLADSINPDTAQRALDYIMMEVKDSVRNQISIKKKCELLSWMGTNRLPI